MIEFVLAFVILVTVVAAMSVGVINGRAPITGSCGGLNNIGLDGACEICGGNPADCDESTGGSGKATSTGSFYNASSKNA